MAWFDNEIDILSHWLTSWICIMRLYARLASFYHQFLPLCLKILSTPLAIKMTPNPSDFFKILQRNFKVWNLQLSSIIQF